jgi:hypothetical protein
MCRKERRTIQLESLTSPREDTPLRGQEHNAKVEKELRASTLERRECWDASKRDKRNEEKKNDEGRNRGLLHPDVVCQRVPDDDYPAVTLDEPVWPVGSVTFKSGNELDEVLGEAEFLPLGHVPFRVTRDLGTGDIPVHTVAVLGARPEDNVLLGAISLDVPHRKIFSPHEAMLVEENTTPALIESYPHVGTAVIQVDHPVVPGDHWRSYLCGCVFRIWCPESRMFGSRYVQILDITRLTDVKLQAKPTDG